MLARSGVIALVTGALLFVLACGTDPVGVEACRQIEKARCENAPACQIDLTKPVHSGTGADKDVSACIRFYDDACLHGLSATSEPGSIAVQACIDAINTGDCTIVKNPETSPACGFLTPTPVPVAADAADEAADASDGG